MRHVIRMFAVAGVAAGVLGGVAAVGPESLAWGASRPPAHVAAAPKYLMCCAQPFRGGAKPGIAIGDAHSR